MLVSGTGGVMNVELLEQIKAKILAEPRQFVMRSFFKRGDGLAAMYRKPAWADLRRFTVPNCGTAACIAGWAISLRMKMTPREVENTHLLPGRVTDDAARALGLSYTQGLRLFHISGWPQQFMQGFEDADTFEARAKVAAARIDHFIATQGVE